MLCSEAFPLLAAELHLKPELPSKGLKFLTSLDVKMLSFFQILHIRGFKTINGRNLAHGRCYINESNY